MSQFNAFGTDRTSKFETLSVHKMLLMAFGVDIKRELRWRKRELPLGFPMSVLKGGTPDAPFGALTITQSQCVYTGHRLFVIPSAVGVCIVQDLKVGKDSQLANSEPIPAEMFAPLSFGADMNDMDTAAVSQIVSLFLGNIDKKEISVTAGMQGLAYQPESNFKSKKNKKGKKK